jgi:hypothetical protein
MNLGAAEGWARRSRGAGWLRSVESLGEGLRGYRRGDGRLLVTGHPEDPPWHFAAHLEMLSRARGEAQLVPWLVDADGLLEAEPGDTVLSVSEWHLPDPVLERLEHVDSRGAAVLGLTAADDRQLAGVARESVSLDPMHLTTSDGIFALDFETASHVFGLVTVRRGLERPRRLVRTLTRR